MAEVFILEDDPSIILEYEMILEEMEIKICGIARTIQQANKLLKGLNPDFAIIDLYVKDQMGFEVIDNLNRRNIPVIVVTGFPKDKYVDQALNMSVYSFLTKPIAEQTLKFTLQKIMEELETDPKETFLFFNSRSKIVKILYSEICHIKADGNYSAIQTKDEKHVIKKSLKRIQETLPDELFVKIYRSILVNILFIDSVSLVKNEVVIGDESLPLSRKYKPLLKERLSSNYTLLKQDIVIEG